MINMSTISKGLFRTSVENQLGASMSHRPLPFIAKRYIFTRLTQSLKGKSEVIAATAIVTGVGTVGYTEYNNDRRHQEILAMSKKVNQAQDRLAKAQEKANRFKLLDIKEKSMSSIPKPDSSSDKEFVPCCVESTYFSSFFYTIKRFFNLF